MEWLDNVKSAVVNTTSQAWDWVQRGASSIAGKIADYSGETVQKVVNGVSKTMPNMLPTATACLAELSYRGTQGSFAAANTDIVLTSKFIDIAAQAPTKFGFPSCTYKTVDSYSGFLLAQHAMFEISGTIDEEQALEDLFNAGVILDWSGMD